MLVEERRLLHVRQVARLVDLDVFQRRDGAPDARRLPWGTSFRVVVPAGTGALDGTALASPFELRFDTLGKGAASASLAGNLGAKAIASGIRTRVREEFGHGAYSEDGAPTSRSTSSAVLIVRSR